MQNYSRKLTIGQFAKFNNTTEQTLRYYDQIGLLHPAEINEITGYRYYYITQCATLDIIFHLKSLGISLKEIKYYFDTNDSTWILDTLNKKYQKNAAIIKSLQETQTVIKRRISDYKIYPSLPKAEHPFIELIPDRIIYKYDTKINYYYNEDSSSNYEYMLRAFKTNLQKQKSPALYFYNVSSIMHMENLISGDFRTTELFVFINEEDCGYFPDYEIIKGNLYFCVICDNSAREIPLINLLLEEISQKGYRIVGDYICEVVSEYLSPKNGQRDMILKLQIPIKFD